MHDSMRGRVLNEFDECLAKVTHVHFVDVRFQHGRMITLSRVGDQGNPGMRVGISVCGS
jgi:hypothetical protein